jgi:hypothetical protein
MSELRQITITHGCGVHTSKAIELLKTGKPGDTLTDEQVSAHVGKNCGVGKAGYGNLVTAMNRVLKDHGVLWVRVRGARALKCCKWDEKHESAGGDMKRAYRAAKKGARKVAAILLDDVPAEKRSEILALGAQLGTIAQFSRGSSTKALEARHVTKPLDMTETLKLMAGQTAAQ